jgi:ABC-type multidrug transport system fused ATPase/permease subunit
VVWVTHRLESIRRVDRILLLAEGRIAEQGSYQDLIGAGGLFFRLAAGEAGGVVDG